MRRKRDWSEIARRRPTYDTNTGYGNPEDWRGTFYEAMGFEEAERVVGDRKPHQVLGVSPTAAWDVVVKAYRAAAMHCHPDRCHVHGLAVEVATQRFQDIQAAFTMLRRQYGKE